LAIRQQRRSFPTPVGVEDFKAVDIEQAKHGDAISSGACGGSTVLAAVVVVFSGQRRVHVLHDPHEQTVVDALGECVARVRRLLARQRARHLAAAAASQSPLHHHHHHHRHFQSGLNSTKLLQGPLFWRGDND